jgi:hypothetical protein
VNYLPKVVISVLQSVATKHKKVVRALVDTGSSRTIVRSGVLPTWAVSKASEDEECIHVVALAVTFKQTIGPKWLFRWCN